MTDWDEILLEYLKTKPDFIEIIDGKYYFDLTHVCKQDDEQALFRDEK